MTNDINKLYQQTIMEYNNRKDLKKEIENPSIVSRGHNPSCGDDIVIFLKIDENDIISDASFTGSACAISNASTAMLMDNIKGKNILDAKKIVSKFFSMMSNEDDLGDEILNDAVLLKFVSNMPARIKCATLAWHSVEEMLERK